MKRIQRERGIKVKGDLLNRERRNFLSNIEETLEDVLNKVKNMRNYERYDSYDEYREDYSRDLLKKFLDTRMQMIDLISLLDEID